MIILDTNVVSEPMKPSGSPAVQAWLDRHPAENLYLTATSLAELLVGIEILHDGKRKKQLAAALRSLMSKLFGTRILPFDQAAALSYASLMARARAAGRILSLADGQIAAIAKSRHFIVATRDTAPFNAIGLQVINPWTA
ncbi:type II toxin-antitoxin system VapC family toxin [Rugamonas sp. A1-17]|nr:type II toxin-antitoxin system VapC family toxin [Rugamonas sp. A1-17]